MILRGTPKASKARIWASGKCCRALGQGELPHRGCCLSDYFTAHYSGFSAVRAAGLPGLSAAVEER